MKKTLLKIFALAFIVTVVMSLASCSAIQMVLESIGIASAHEHSYGEWENLDAENHKRTCECDDVQTATHAWVESGRTDATHTAEGSVSYACVCGATKTEPLDKTPDHSYGEWENLDAENHKKTCECGDVQTAPHSLNDNDECFCGYAAEHTHKYATTISYDADGHWYAATCSKDASCTDAKSGYAAHNFTDGDICSCGYEKSFRGTGDYADLGLNFAGETATGLKEAGTLSGDVNFDSTSKPAVNVTEVNGDNALTLTSKSSSKYVGVAIMENSGNKIVFQTDFYIDGASDSWGTNGTIAEIYAQINGTTNNFSFGSFAFYSERIKDDAGTIIGHKYFLHTDSVADSKFEISADEWHTLTLEREDIKHTSNLNAYLDGELILTFSRTQTTTALSHMKIATKANTDKVTIHFDNIYFGSVEEE